MFFGAASHGCGINSMKPIKGFHNSIEQRLQAARRFEEEAHLCGELMCDSMSNHALERYIAYPDRLVVIEKGVIVHNGGPRELFFYNVDSIIDWFRQRYPNEIDKRLDQSGIVVDNSDQGACTS